MSVAVSNPITAIAQALSDALMGVNIRSLPYLSDTFTPPVALVGIREAAYHNAFGAFAQTTYTFDVLLILARGNDRAALTAMEGYMSNGGSLSIRAALEADQTVGGTGDSCICRHAGPPEAIAINGQPYTSCPFEVEVSSS